MHAPSPNCFECHDVRKAQTVHTGWFIVRVCFTARVISVITRNEFLTQQTHTWFHQKNKSKTKKMAVMNLEHLDLSETQSIKFTHEIISVKTLLTHCTCAPQLRCSPSPRGSTAAGSVCGSGRPGPRSWSSRAPARSVRCGAPSSPARRRRTQHPSGCCCCARARPAPSPAGCRSKTTTPWMERGCLCACPAWLPEATEPSRAGFSSAQGDLQLTRCGGTRRHGGDGDVLRARGTMTRRQRPRGTNEPRACSDWTSARRQPGLSKE